MTCAENPNDPHLTSKILLIDCNPLYENKTTIDQIVRLNSDTNSETKMRAIYARFGETESFLLKESMIAILVRFLFLQTLHLISCMFIFAVFNL